MDESTPEEVPAKKRPAFEGFRKIDKESKHFYKLPNEWTDIMAGIDNLAELKIIEYLIRHTWGFGEYDQYKHITVDEFMHGRLRVDGTRMDKGTGLKSDRSVKDGLKAAIEHGYILCDVDASDRARIKKSYKLKIREVDTTPQEVDATPQDDQEEDRQVDTTPQEGSNYPPDTQNLPPNQADSTPRTQKETSRQNHTKESGKESDTPQKKSLGYGEIYLKDFLLSIGKYGERREYVKRLEDIYANCDIDDRELFRSKIDSVAYKAKLAPDPIEAFFSQLVKQL